jgi:hypothetical protein
MLRNVVSHTDKELAYGPPVPYNSHESGWLIWGTGTDQGDTGQEEGLLMVHEISIFMPSLLNIGIFRSILAKRFKLLVGYNRIYIFARRTCRKTVDNRYPERYTGFRAYEERQ